MGRRVYHLAAEAGVSPEDALKILRSAGFPPNSIKDLIARNVVRDALSVLRSGKFSEQDNPSSEQTTRSNLSVGERIESHFRRQDIPSTLPSPDRTTKSNLVVSIPRRKRERHHTVHYLNIVNLLEIHEALVLMFAEENDPIFPPGVKHEGLLESAIHRPQTSLGDVEKYDSVLSKGAAFFHSLVRNHAFHNGNKRTSLVALVVFLDLNDYLIDTTDDELFKFVIDSARPNDGARADDEVERVRSWLYLHCTRGSASPSDMSTNEFLERIEQAGGRYRPGKKGASWIVWGPNGDSVRISRKTASLGGSVVRKYLQKLGLSHGQSGIRFQEFEAGVDVNQRLIRRFRAVLKNLAHA
jgi:death-on-curing family protein